MANTNREHVEIEEVTSILTPNPGITLDQALSDAQLLGAKSIVIDRDNNQAIITWFKREKKKPTPPDLSFLGTRTGLG